ncbi:MAG: porin family protein [Pseudolabrys sp.]|nr:porin family protein [Pseudolabrys sp.]
MMCTRSKILILATAAAASLTAGAARAADYAQPQPCYDPALIASGRAPYGAVPCYVPPPVVEEFSSWYLRGDIGFSNQSVRSISNRNYANYDSVVNIDRSFDAAPLFGIGIGYYFNDWLRLDITGEYRGRANFHGLDIGYNPAPNDDVYTGSKSELTFMANAYFDLGTWYNFTPFVGAGVGISRNTISSFRDTSASFNSTAYADAASKWSFAWAVHAGVGYKLTKNATIEFAYRYIDLGNAESGNITNYVGVTGGPYEFKRLTSHDLKVGLRFNFDGFGSSAPAYYAPAPVYQAPVYQAPPPVYQPAPVYVQPPLRSKG